MSRHVAVLMGGWSAEREVSLTSGKAVVDALTARGYRVSPVDMDRNVAATLAQLQPDVVFNALHGTPGEDGTVQGLLDLMGLPYTHSGVAASAVAMDKQLAKTVLTAAGLRMPEGKVVCSADLFSADPLPRPFVLKPVSEGSSVGVAIITEDSTAGQPIRPDAPGPWQTFDELLAETFIPGRELTVAVLGDEPLAVTELRPRRGFYDYDAKYTDGVTEHVLPAPVPADVATAAMDIAVKAHSLLGCNGVSRSDFRFNDSKGADGLYLLEVNTQPGLTRLSLVPEQAAYRGISFADLVERILAAARSAGGAG